MIKIFDYKKDRLKVARFLELINITDDSAEKTVRAIVENVRKKGDTALLSYIKKFEASPVKKEELRVSDREIDDAVKKVGKDFFSILSEAKNNIIRYHKKGMLKSFLYDDGDNVKLGKVVQPIENAGVYIPGGKAVYPSSVLMNVIPAQIAGVKNIYAASPPDKNKNVNEYILAACSVLGVRDIFKMGGAHAVAAFAYGTDTVPKVDKIVGPGNIYVATAKKLVYGDVDIDMIAGPSEVVVCADSSAKPAYIVSELFAQAEHDENARAVMVTTSKKTAEKVQIEIKRQIKLRARKEIIKKSLKNNGAIILVNSVKQCAEIINTIAPEHLQLSVGNPERILKLIKNAGAIFVGNYSPVAAGDYFAGPNHVLPTGRSARFSSPLSVNDFLKESSIIYYSKERLNKKGRAISQFALLEGLDAHAYSVTVRTNKN